MNAGKKKMPVKEGLWTTPEGQEGNPRLLASRCVRCREIFFPQRQLGVCSHCQSTELELIPLSTQGKIFSYTVIMQRPPEYYRGDIPYAIGFVELPEGVRIQTLFTGCDPENLRTGMKMEMVIERLQEDEMGNEIVTYKFRPTNLK
jgi:uncharacterized OB-fold protein